jgi:beta-lactamase regulating signal transducer with metallopeptidase domain
MTAEFLAALLRVNLAGAAAALIVLALRRPARRAFGAAGSYRLWALVPLACLAVLLPPRTQPAPSVTPPAAPATLMTGPAFAGLAAPATSTPPAMKPSASTKVGPAPSSVPTSFWLLAVWGVGAIISLAVLAWRQRRFVATLGRLRRGEGGLVLAEGAGVGPAVVGVLSPRVVVPADFEARFTAEERAVVLAHERAHLARQDARTNGVVALAQCLAWFNPVVHLAARFVRLDQELACDADVVARFPGARRRYAEALLKTQISATPLPLGCYWPSRSTHPLEERIEMLKTRTPGAGRRLAGAVAVGAVCLAGGVAAWASQPAQTEVAKVAPFSRLPFAAPIARLTATAAQPAPPAAAAASPAEGDWIGALKSPDLRIAFHIRKAAGGALAGTLDSPDQAAYDIPLQAVSETDGALSLSVPSLKATYAAKWNADSRSWVGQWAQAGANWQLDLTSGRYPAPKVIAGLDGAWDTTLVAGSGKLRLGFIISTDAHGTHGVMDSPDQNTYHLPLSTTARDGQQVTFGFKASDVTVTGTLSADGQTITGQFTQFGGSLPVVLTRRAPGAAAPYPPPHAVAQAPKPPIVSVDAGVLATYVGDYRIAPGLDLVITADAGHLYAQITNQPKLEVFASSPTEFFWKQADASIAFGPVSGGQAPYAILHQGGRYLLGQRAS